MRQRETRFRLCRFYNSIGGGYDLAGKVLEGDRRSCRQIVTIGLASKYQLCGEAAGSNAALRLHRGLNGHVRDVERFLFIGEALPFSVLTPIEKADPDQWPYD